MIIENSSPALLALCWGHDLSVVRQWRILKQARSTAYHKPQPTSDSDLQLMCRIDELYLEYPFAGSRMLRDLLLSMKDSLIK